MSALEALKMAALKPFADALRQMMTDAGFTVQNDFAIAVWGLDANGKASRSGHCSQILSGKNRATDKALTEMAPHLNKTPAELIAMRDEMVLPIDPRALVPSPREVRAAAASTKPSKVKPPMVYSSQAPVLPSRPAEQFALVIAQNGLATLRLNLVDIPMKDALRAMGALTAAGILNAGEDPS
jgi:hypothetical protein